MNERSADLAEREEQRDEADGDGAGNARQRPPDRHKASLHARCADDTVEDATHRVHRERAHVGQMIAAKTPEDVHGDRRERIALRPEHRGAGDRQQ
ncbi:MAG: hypothetical protein ACK559_22825, partial [bacterium]